MPCRKSAHRCASRIRKWSNNTAIPGLAPCHWHRPFHAERFCADVSATVVRNPDYWGRDERHPENKLPYLDALKFYVILDQEKNAGGNARRTHRCRRPDFPGAGAGIAENQPGNTADCASGQYRRHHRPRNDRPPFNDIRVRKAMQLAIDLNGIAKNYYKAASNRFLPR